jgi:predicted nucleic acid-binding protein
VIVLDSSFLIAFHNARDVHHAAASSAMERLLDGGWGEALLPEYVFLEVTTVLAARRNLETAVAVGEALLSAPELELVPCADTFLEAFSVFRGQGRRGLSFADAAIVAIARQRGASFVATFDSGFRGLRGLRMVPAAGG